MNENDRLTIWDSTMMPNIPGIPAIICLMFSPCVEIRYIPFKLGLCFGMIAQTRDLNPPFLFTRQYYSTTTLLPISKSQF